MEKRMRIGNALYYIAYIVWLTVAALRMTRIDDIVTFKYGRLVSAVDTLIVILLIAKLLLQKVELRQLICMILLYFLILKIGSNTSVSKLMSFFWLTCCVAKTSEKKVLWCYFFVHSALMVLAVSLTRAGVLENLIFEEGDRIRQSIGYDYCAYSSHILLALTMVYVYVRKKFHIWEAAGLLALNYINYRLTDTRTALILSVLVVVSVWLIRRFDIRLPVNFFTRLLFQAGPVAVAAGMWLVQYYYSDKIGWMRWLNIKINSRLMLGYNALHSMELPLFGQTIKWVGVNARRADPSLVYNTVDNSYLRYTLQYGIVLMVVVVAAIVLLQGRLLKQQNTVLLWMTTIFFSACSLNPNLFHYKSQPFMLLLGYLLVPVKRETDRSGHGDNRKKEWLKKLFIPLGALNERLPKKKDCILFYSNLGMRDNVRALYEEMLRLDLHKKYKIILSLDDAEDFRKKCPKEVKCVSNKMGLFYYLRASYIFYSFGKLPIEPGRDQQIINLWHGMPLKRIGNMEESLKDIRFDYFSKVLATSEFFAGIMQQVFGCERERVLICGQPRTDALFRSFTTEEQKELWYADKPCAAEDFQTAKKLVWLPTYRPGEENGLFSTLGEEDMERLDAFLEDHGALLWVKLHPLQKFDSEKLHALKFQRICIYAQEDIPDIDLYEILSFSDALLTDYSSIYFDYLMLDRPIGFLVGDLKQYEGDRGFVFEDYENYMPGRQIVDYDELAEFIERVCRGEDNYKEDRKRVNALTNLYCDGENAVRLLEKIGIDTGKGETK